MTRRIYHIDELTNICGYFNNLENYNCEHLDAEEADENGKGLCFATSCPISHLLDKAEFDNKVVDRNGFDQCDTCTECEDDPENCTACEMCELVVVEIENGKIKGIKE